MRWAMTGRRWSRCWGEGAVGLRRRTRGKTQRVRLASARRASRRCLCVISVRTARWLTAFPACSALPCEAIAGRARSPAADRRGIPRLSGPDASAGPSSHRVVITPTACGRGQACALPTLAPLVTGLLQESRGVGQGESAHPAATSRPCGQASLAPLPQAGGVGGG